MVVLLLNCNLYGQFGDQGTNGATSKRVRHKFIERGDSLLFTNMDVH